MTEGRSVYLSIDLVSLKLPETGLIGGVNRLVDDGALDIRG
jgi:hypothetical protein